MLIIRFRLVPTHWPHTHTHVRLGSAYARSRSDLAHSRFRPMPRNCQASGGVWDRQSIQPLSDGAHVQGRSSSTHCSPRAKRVGRTRRFDGGTERSLQVASVADAEKEGSSMYVAAQKAPSAAWTPTSTSDHLQSRDMPKPINLLLRQALKKKYACHSLGWWCGPDTGVVIGAEIAAVKSFCAFASSSRSQSTCAKLTLSQCGSVIHPQKPPEAAAQPLPRTYARPCLRLPSKAPLSPFVFLVKTALLKQATDSCSLSRRFAIDNGASPTETFWHPAVHSPLPVGRRVEYSRSPVQRSC
jgi:hypothetical protein